MARMALGGCCVCSLSDACGIDGESVSSGPRRFPGGPAYAVWGVLVGQCGAL